MKKSIMLACAVLVCGQAFGSNFAETAKKLRMQQEQEYMNKEKQHAEMKENLSDDAKSLYRAAEYKIGIRVINTASSWMIEVKDPISFGNWIPLSKANSPLDNDNVCYITALRDFKVRVVDQKTQQPVPGSEMTIKRDKGQDIFAINVRSVSAGKSTPTISYEAFTADSARELSKFNNLDL